MKKALILCSVILSVSLLAPAESVTSSPVNPTMAEQASSSSGNMAAAEKSNAGETADLPQTATPLPLFGLLAFGFLIAGYMTLKTEKRTN